MSSGMSGPLGRTLAPQGAGLGTGDVTVDVNVAAATFTIYGPETFGTNGVNTGTGDTTYTGVDAGGYHVVFGAVAGYTTPAMAGGVLEDTSTLTLTGTYVASGVGGGMVAGLLNETFTHKRPVLTDNGSGEWTEGTPTTVGTVKGRYQMANANELEQGQRQIGKLYPAVITGPSEDIKKNDTLTREFGNNDILRVVSIQVPSAAWYQKAWCEETQVET